MQNNIQLQACLAHEDTSCVSCGGVVVCERWCEWIEY